ncbi:MAG TPA: formate dehydrogenase subunit gamma [Burkholderiales bacterium]|jgi:formate dehydrogenase subunit gamma|nr:formate dehydrogenase subunit gamma [Burkholderiales bacterium]
MSTLSRLAGCMLAFLALAAAGTVQAQVSVQEQQQQQQQRRLEQPGNNAPVWREVRKEGQEHYTSVKGRETGVLVQSAGETWRQIRNGPITFYGGWLVVLVTLALAAFYFAKGPLKLHEKPTGRMIERFSLAERWAHWTMGISFVVLGISGLIILFGKHVLLPVIGYTLFAWLTALAKNLHNFVAPLFIVSLLVFIVMFAKDNVYQKGDIGWLAKAWNMFAKGEHVPSWRFNMGEKVYFWIGVVGLCLALSVTGLILLFPNFDQVRSTMQLASIVHASAAMVMIAFALGHIYVGTIGVEGAYRNMADGVTDEAWAKEHHELWYNELKRGPKSAPGGAIPAGAPRARET